MRLIKNWHKSSVPPTMAQTRKNVSYMIAPLAGKNDEPAVKCTSERMLRRRLPLGQAPDLSTRLFADRRRFSMKKSRKWPEWRLNLVTGRSPVTRVRRRATLWFSVALRHRRRCAAVDLARLDRGDRNQFPLAAPLVTEGVDEGEVAFRQREHRHVGDGPLP